MEHSDFVVAWNQRKLEIDVDRLKAFKTANSKMLPKRFQAAHIFWSSVWILAIPTAIAVMFLYKWWVGLLILIFVTPLISKSTKKSAMQFMIDYALESPEFYQFALAEGVIRIRQKP